MDDLIMNLQTILKEAMDMREESWHKSEKRYFICMTDAARNVCKIYGVPKLEDIIFALLTTAWNECNDFVFDK